MTTKRRVPNAVRRPGGRVGAAPAAAPRSETALATAAYIAEMTHELAGIARGARQEMLVYFLTMARMEAEAIARGREANHPS